MKRIGMRTIKTLISIFICLMIFISLKGLCVLLDAGKDYAFLWYNPFFAAIATAYSIYPNRKKSLEQASNRCIASLIGGFVGVLLVVFYEFIYSKIHHLEFGGYWPTLTSNIEDLIIPYLLVAAFTILVVSIGVRIKKQGAIFVGILTFLSITVNANSKVALEIGEWGFGLNRILSTLIGVLVALFVNEFRIPRFHKNKDLLFAIGIDSVIYSDVDKIKGYMNYKINSFAVDKINTTLFTTRTPVTFMHILEDVDVTHPIICMGGAALYDAKKLEYIAVETINYEDQKILDEYFEELKITPFKNYIIDNVLNVYCKEINNDGERFYMNQMKNAAYCNFILGENITEVKDAVFYITIEKDDVAHQIINHINNNFGNKFYAQEIDAFDKEDKLEGIKYVKIYSNKIKELNIVKNYCKEKGLRLVGLSSSKLTMHLLEVSQIDVSTYEYKSSIQVKTFDDMMKKVSSIYHNKKYQRESQVDSNE